MKQKVGQHPHINVTDNDDMGQWDAVIMGNDGLLEKYKQSEYHIVFENNSVSYQQYRVHHQRSVIWDSKLCTSVLYMIYGKSQKFLNFL